ncbi:MAG: hypothetical protein V4736_05015, partial [Bdellovibrionota bacterium]
MSNFEMEINSTNEHSQIEECYPFSQLLKKEIKSSDVLKNLKAHYSFFSEPLDFLVSVTEQPEALIYQDKKRYLVSDLIREGVNLTRISLHPFNAPKTEAAILAWKYVFLSSCLGNNAIVEQLAENKVNFPSEYLSSKNHQDAWQRL